VQANTNGTVRFVELSGNALCRDAMKVPQFDSSSAGKWELVQRVMDRADQFSFRLGLEGGSCDFLQIIGKRAFMRRVPSVIDSNIAGDNEHPGFELIRSPIVKPGYGLRDPYKTLLCKVFSGVMSAPELPAVILIHLGCKSIHKLAPCPLISGGEACDKVSQIVIRTLFR